MPFKLLKKSRQYNVMSKDLYVISVVCLDGSNFDCTLSNDSKGSECLENVCQRAGLNQNEFFGLRYYPKGSSDECSMRWVDLERPLSRQLEKHAANTKVLYLRIMYYVISTVSLTDDATRNYYFLQLKQDVVEGKISCDPKVAVILANYSRQAEYGNYQDRHKSVDYLKSLLSFPKHLVDAGMLEILTEEVIQHHDQVQDVTQASAEELYISLCQQLDGYGQETFVARNDEGVEVMLGISVSGVIVGYTGSHKFYPWREIVNVVNHKRTFNIECVDSSHNVGFQLPDADTGRYLWRLCVCQHTFFINYEQNHASQVNLSLFRNIPENFNDSREDLLRSTDDKIFYASNSHLALPNSTTNLSINNNPSTWVTSSESLLAANRMDSRTSLKASAIDVNLPTMLGSNQWNAAGSNVSLINRAQSSSCLDLVNSNVQQVNKEHLKSLLPSYRPAPSYETAIQQKYRGSHPDIGQSIYENYAHAHNQSHQRYPDVTHHAIGPKYSDASEYGLQQRFKMMNVKPPPQYSGNRLSSTSTPDLALSSHRALLNGYRTSGSSPDLVSSRPLLHHGLLTSNAHSILYPYPSMANHHGMKHRLRHSHSFLPHATYENLNFIETANPNFFPPKHTPNNLIFRTASSAAAVQHRHQAISLNALNLSNTHINEPIYENFPLQSSESKPVEAPPKKVSPESLLGHTRSYQPASQERDVNLNNIPSMSTSASSLYQSQQTKQREQHSMTISSASSSSKHNDTVDSGSSTISGKKEKGEKRNKIWKILSGGGKTKNSVEFKSNTLGREKTKNKKEKSSTLTKEDDNSSKHRSWSTGQPKLKPLPSNISKEQLCQLLEAKLNDSQLFLEFERIPKRKDNAKYTCALLEENRAKNSDMSLALPMDENRVKLTASRDNRMGYCNASHITTTVGHKQKFYISAQSPFDSTTANIFWQCVWEADVYLIIQLSEDSLQYVPNTSERCLEYGQYQVWKEFSQETNNVTTSKLRIYHTQSRRYRAVWHLSCYEFNEQHSPKNLSQFLKFLEELNSVRLASISEVPSGHNSNPPVMIHCNEGERTGLTLIADLLLYTLDHNQDLDIPRVVGQIREQRDKIIPSLVQYKFIYSLLIYYLKQSRLI